MKPSSSIAGKSGAGHPICSGDVFISQLQTQITEHRAIRDAVEFAPSSGAVLVELLGHGGHKLTRMMKRLGSPKDLGSVKCWSNAFLQRVSIVSDFKKHDIVRLSFGVKVP